MSVISRAGRALASLALAAAILLPAASRAETFVGSNVDSRVLVGLKASPGGVQALLPEGWASVPFPGGPLAGANVLFVFIDGRLEMDPDGKPLDPPSRRAVALVGLGKQTDGEKVALFVLRAYTTAPERDPYGVNVAAEIGRSQEFGGPAAGARSVKDEWRVAADGGELKLELAYSSGARSFAPGEANPHSAADPGFSRIYRYEQMVDLVMSSAVGKPMAGEYELESTIAGLAGILDGSEETVAVIDVPVYVRKVFLPD